MERELPHEYREAPGLGHVWALWDEQIAVFFDLLDSRGFTSTQ
jgi:S-formylglutathione hydrolase FrmB